MKRPAFFIMALFVLTAGSLRAEPPVKKDLNLLEGQTAITSQGILNKQIDFDTPSDTTNPFVITGESLVTLIGEMGEFQADESIVFYRRTGQLFVKARPINQKMIERVISDLRRSMAQQVVIEARFVEVKSFDGLDLGVEWGDIDYNGSTIGANTDASSGQSVDFAAANFGTVATTVSPALNIFGSFNSNNVSLDTIVRGLAQKQKINTLSAPKITCYNNQRANIRVEKSESYIRRIKSDLVASSATTFAVQAEAVIGDAVSGVVLEVVPTINDDDTITLELHPNVVSADLSTTATIASASDVDNPVTLPVFIRQSIDTTVTMRNGGTIVLGGLITNTERDDVRKVPILGDVPIIRHLFRYRTQINDKAYLLIFISARRVMTDTHES